MYDGVFEGKKAGNQKVKILILGESHHWDENKQEDKRTDKVIFNYLEKYKDRNYRFFENIVKTFGVDPKKRAEFWDLVWFGNYIESPCGVRDRTAANLLKKAGNRQQYNNNLFAFIEKNEIDVVFCFSRKVYNKLPPLDLESEGDYASVDDPNDSHRLYTCVYVAGERKSITTSLSKSVTVYGLKHPSQGYSYHKYRERIAEIVKEHSLPFSDL